VDMLAAHRGYYSQLTADDLALVDNLGRLLAHLPDPRGSLAIAIERVHKSGEGWKANYKGFLDSIRGVAYLLTIGAMASHRMKESGKDATGLFDFVWSHLHTWLRTLPDSVGEDEVRTVICHTWARLHFVDGEAGVSRAVAALRRIDHLDWIMHAAINWQRNLPPNQAELDVGVQVILRARFTALFPTFRGRHTTTAELSAHYEAELLRLTPSI
jgi:hypothetical protein